LKKGAANGAETRCNARLWQGQERSKRAGKKSTTSSAGPLQNERPGRSRARAFRFSARRPIKPRAYSTSPRRP